MAAGSGFSDSEAQQLECLIAPRASSELPPAASAAAAARRRPQTLRALAAVVAVGFGLAAAAALLATARQGNPAAIGGLLRADGEQGAGIESLAEGGGESAEDGQDGGEGGQAEPVAEAGWEAGWFLAEADQNCEEACEAKGLLCEETEQHAHREEVGTHEKMQQMMSASGKTCSLFNESYGSEEDVPIISGDGTCFISDPDREQSSWSCRKTPWPEGAGKQRLCMCSAASVPCTANGANCMESTCCSDAGMTCWRKNDHWASCNLTCSPNMMWVDDKWAEQNETVWECKALSTTPKWSCTANGQNCMESKCCSEDGMTCFRKNEHWSSCNDTCNENMLWKDDRWQEQDEKVWMCDVLTQSSP